MKIYESYTDEEIALYMQKNNVCKIRKDGAMIFPDPKKMKYQLWSDSFYYGFFQYNNKTTDLREVNPHYQPVISEEEFMMLMKIIQKREESREVTYDEEKVYVYPFEDGIIYDEKGADKFTPMIPNIKRFRTKLNELRMTKPDATLADVVSSQNIHYRLMRTTGKQKNQTIKFSDMEGQIIEFLKCMNMDDETHKEYCGFARDQFEKSDDEIVEERRLIQFSINKADGDYKKFLKKNLGKDRDEAEEEVYQSEKKNFETIIASLETDLANNKRKDKATVMEFEAFV